MEIRQISEEHIARAAEVIRQSFRTVADDFGLTPENCASHPAFLPTEQLLAHTRGGLQLFGLYADEVLAGAVAIKEVNSREFTVEKLAVLPDYRHRRFGEQLMMFACEQIVRSGGETVCIGIVDENAVLKQWYQRQGFAVISINRFAHLPFTVCLMQKTLNRS